MQKFVEFHLPHYDIPQLSSQATKAQQPSTRLMLYCVFYTRAIRTVKLHIAIDWRVVMLTSF